jgi:hypothetical protein
VVRPCQHHLPLLPSVTDGHRPGSSLHYIEVIENPRYEDFNFKYNGVRLPLSTTEKKITKLMLTLAREQINMWKYLGNGKSRVLEIEGGDRSPYMSLENIDKEWLKNMKTPAAAEVGRNEKVNEGL